MKNSEFLLSSLQEAVRSVTDPGVPALATGSILGLITIILAVITVTPPNLLNFVRIGLLAFVAGVMIIFAWILRQLQRLSRLKARWLRRWELDVYLSEKVNNLSQDSIRRLMHLIHELQDDDGINAEVYERRNTEFLSILQ